MFMPAFTKGCFKGFVSFRLLVCYLLLVVSATLPAQTNDYPYHIGLIAGAAHYSGDLTDRPLVPEQIRPALGITGGMMLNRFIGIRATGMWFTLSAADSHSEDPIRNARNLSFRSRIWEGSVQVVVMAAFGKQIITPYLCGGVAAFRFNPKAKYNGEWVALQPLGTEGQGLHPLQMRKYKLSSWGLPIGLGCRYRLTKQLALFAEAAYRKTFTDYIDDVSTNYYSKTELIEKRGEVAAALSDRSSEVIGENNLFSAGSVRGNPNYNDGYFLLTFTAAWSLGNSQSSGLERCYKF